MLQARVQRVRMAGGVQAPQTRRRVERWISALDPAAGGLPSQAIVIVRRLGIAASTLDRDAAGSPAWQRTLRGLVRPALADAVGAGVQGVWFADEAELMACAAHDTLRGTLAGRWWWALLLAPHVNLQGVVRRWAASPRTLPAATRRLGAPDARAWWQEIGVSGRASLLEALAQAFVLGDAVRDALAPHPHAALPVRVAVGDDAAGPSASTTGDATPGTGTAQPAGAGEDLLVARCVELLQHLADDAMAATDEALPARWKSAGARAFEPVRQGPADRRGPPSPPAPPAVQASTAAALVRPAPPPMTAGHAPAIPAAEPAAGTVTPPRPAAVAVSAAGAHPGRPLASPAVPAPRPMQAAPGSTAPAPAALVTVAPLALQTGFGGLFFLLNAMLSAGWYGDFTQPRHPGLPLSPWRLLHEAGRRWFGRAYRADPLADWLVARAPRSAVPAAPRVWTAPASWTSDERTDGQPWHALVAPGDVRWWHPGGFIAARAPSLDAAPPDGLPPHGRIVVHPVRARPLSMVQLLLPVLGARLALALGLPEPRAAAALALRLPARLTASDERVDLHVPLTVLPLAVRLAGLDRDPGWIPAAGRDVRLHFG